MYVFPGSDDQTNVIAPVVVFRETLPIENSADGAVPGGNSGPAAKFAFTEASLSKPS